MGKIATIVHIIQEPDASLSVTVLGKESKFFYTFDSFIEHLVYTFGTPAEVQGWRDMKTLWQNEMGELRTRDADGITQDKI